MRVTLEIQVVPSPGYCGSVGCVTKGTLLDERSLCPLWVLRVCLNRLVDKQNATN